MPHHGSNFDPELAEILRRQVEDLRRENPYPQGKLTPSDEGVQTFGVGASGGKVIIQFAGPTTWIGMNPDQADELAGVLRKRATEARGQG